MKIKIQSFFTLSMLILGAYFTITTMSYFYDIERSRVNIILKNINTNLNELSYNLSKDVKNLDELVSKRALFDRIVANNDFINAILIFDDKKLIISTNADIKEIDTLNHPSTNTIITFNDLKNAHYIFSDIRYYENDRKLKELLLVYVLEKDEIIKHFEEQKNQFFLFLVFLPSLGFVFLIYLLKNYISHPLERLRQYAYYHTEIPPHFKIKELEAIRHSMIDTFTRLEDEKKVLYNMARTDNLSGLANRNSLNEFLERVIPVAIREKKEFAYLFLDLDHFKHINDSLGHDIGDELLKSISGKIKEILRANDFVARIGGDEFVIIIQDFSSYIELTKIIERIKSTVSKSWLINTTAVNVGCSIGVAVFPKDGDNEITLMKNSDIAMYEAKKLGRNQYHFFTEELHDSIQKLLTLSNEIKFGIENNQFELYYQPKVDINSSKIVGVEALIRWNHPKKGLVYPNDFISFAEENDLIKRIDKWVILNAINQYKKWEEKGIDLSISINISSKQLDDKNFISKIVELIDKYSIPKSKIDFEITEYTLLNSNICIDENIQKLKNAGITLSLDDFGTGYSSLSYLKKLPLDYLKIDKSFIDDYNTPQDAVFIETIVKMAQTLNLKVIAEGVENKEQLEYLKSINCDEYQGYIFSKPIKAIELEKLYFLITS